MKQNAPHLRVVPCRPSHFRAEILASTTPTVVGLNHLILDGQPEQTRSKQE